MESSSIPDAPSGIVIHPLPDSSPVSSADMGDTVQQYPLFTYDMIDEARRLKAIGDSYGSSQLFEQAGHSGNPEGFYELSRMYQDGTLLKDDAAMLGYLEQAHDQGFVEATRVLGHLYLLGLVAPQNAAYGRLLIEQAAEVSARAMREYGEMLSNIRSPKLDDLPLGIEYLEKAVASGHSEAQRSLANAYIAAGRHDEALVIKADQSLRDGAPAGELHSSVTLADLSDIDRALLSGPKAIYDVALQILIRKRKDPDPEFTGYCLMAVAGSQGYEPALQELRYLDGVRSSMGRTDPGKIEACIAEHKRKANIPVVFNADE